MINRGNALIAGCILLAILLTGCGSAAEMPATENATLPTVTVTKPPASTESSAPPETAAPTEQTEETSPPEETVAPAAEVPYLQRIPYADQNIFTGPGYDYSLAGTVKEAGTYTIVEEARDVEDNLWGRLKSGVGWVDLTDIRSEARKKEPLRANYADDLLLKSGDFHRYTGSSSEYAVSIAFRANENLTDVTLCSMELSETMEVTEQLFFLSRLEPGKPLVADLEFPGDMTTYAVFFTDSNGNFRKCTVSISGRNGTVELIEP